MPSYSSPPNSRPADRGFTLVELMIVLAIAGVLLGFGGWRMQSFITGNRTSAAARDFLVRVRSASAIAARTNGLIEIAFVDTGAGCVPRYELREAGGKVYERVCIADEYPGVQLGSITMSGTALKCADEALALPDCSLCPGGGTKVLTLYPSGEVATSGASVAGDSVVFSVRNETSAARTVAVGIRNVSGRTRVYRPNATASGWTCP